MNVILQSSIHTLKKSKTLLSSICNETLSNCSVSPYYSCVGSHVRHILDFYDCILDGIETNEINLTNRKRDELMHSNCDYAINNIDRVLERLKVIDQNSFENKYIVIDDLGLGEVTLNYTLDALLAQANSHAIHHYAIISYILDRLEINIQDETFGYNPTTPRVNSNLN